MIKVEQLTKNYGDFQAVSEVSFTVKQGEIFGLLGPNGAGKSTLINCISGLLEPSQGEVIINSHPIRSKPLQAKSSLGVVPQELALYEDLSALENLDFWGQAYGLRGDMLKQRIQEVLQQVGLEQRQKDQVNSYSGGMKRRLNFACAILHQPQVLLLDEPTVGVDPQSREHLLQTVQDLQQAGTAVLYTSHYMEEVEKLCDRIAIIDHGKTIAHGTVEQLRQELGERDLISLEGDFSHLDQQLIEDFEVLEWSAQQVRFLAANAAANLPQILARFEQAKISQTSVRQANLESLFIKLTGRNLRD